MAAKKFIHHPLSNIEDISYLYSIIYNRQEL